MSSGRRFEYVKNPMQDESGDPHPNMREFGEGKQKKDDRHRGDLVIHDGRGILFSQSCGGGGTERNTNHKCRHDDHGLDRPRRKWVSCRDLVNCPGCGEAPQCSESPWHEWCIAKAKARSEKKHGRKSAIAAVGHGLALEYRLQPAAWNLVGYSIAQFVVEIQTAG